MYKSQTERKENKKTIVDVVLVCDSCASEFTKSVIKSRAAILRTNLHHYCSHKCYGEARKKGGLSYALAQETCVKTYGSTHHMKSNDFKKKFYDDFEAKHGVRTQFQTEQAKVQRIERMNDPEEKQRLREVWLGDKNPAKREDVKEKIVAGLREWAQTTYGVDNASQVSEIYAKGRQTCVERYGDEYPTRTKAGQEKRQQTCLKKFGASHERRSSIFMNNVMLRRYGMTWDQYKESLPEYVKYRREVWRITEAQDTSLIENYDKRGKSFHLDHKFSIAEGFRQNIPPEVIGNVVNLRVIEARENISKSDKCTLSIDELLSLYEESISP